MACFLLTILLSPIGEKWIISHFVLRIVSHSRGRETSSSYYGKRQSQFLSFVVWYCRENPDGTITRYKTNFDFISSYLSHTSLFWQKCTSFLLTHLKQEMGVRVKKVQIAVSSGNQNSDFLV